MRALALSLLCLVLAVPARAAARVDNSLYAQLLAAHVHAGVVDYAGLKVEEAKLDAYLAVLERTGPATLDLEERKAFYINAYNAWTLKLILTGYPGVKSIKDLGGLFSGPWSRQLVRIAGKVLTLDEVEHGILRKPPFTDPRIHFAVNCASKSCPPLRSVPYVGERLDEQLDQAAHDFINAAGSVVVNGDLVWVSKIFDWYGADFGDAPLDFVRRYARDGLLEKLDALGSQARVRFLEYDWSLNGA
jgi:hypothetical protein